MADNTNLRIGDNSPEQIAFKLMERIAWVEKKEINHGGENSADREWILSTYRECLSAVQLRSSVKVAAGR